MFTVAADAAAVEISALMLVTAHISPAGTVSAVLVLNPADIADSSELGVRSRSKP